MSVWRDVVGQESAVEVLQRAVEFPDQAMTHAWLFTGPPGSGRSNLARAFAAALLCPQGGCGACAECRTALDGTHADVTVLATQALSIKVEDARALAAASASAPSVGRWRVVVVEDADRLTERAADALLKAVEEPASRTVWVLCAPSLQDVIVTIRSRCRHVRLRTPSVEAVADLLQRRDGVDPQLAVHAARAAQSHVGVARWLARDEPSRERRSRVLGWATRIHGVSDAVRAAGDLVQMATEDAGASGEAEMAEAKRTLLLTLGADPDARTQPPHVRSQLAALEKDHKTRATRRVRDGLDQALVTLLALYRDVLVQQWGAAVDPINDDCADAVRRLAEGMTPREVLAALDAVAEARQRLHANVAPLLALEAMAMSLQTAR